MTAAQLAFPVDATSDPLPQWLLVDDAAAVRHWHAAASAAERKWAAGHPQLGGDVA